MNRRHFFQAAFLTVGALIGYSAIANAEERRRGSRSAPGGAKAGACGPLVDTQEPAAKSVNYVHKGSDIKDAKLKTERSGVKFDSQKCNNCAFYLKDKECKVDGKTAAPCQMPFAANKVVTADGWCSSWAKKS
jgi:hypothetical protein